MIAAFLLLTLCSLAPGALSVPPRPPVRCGGDGDGDAGCVLSNAYGAWSSDRVDCPVAAVAYPASERDVVAAVARASAGGMRVKAVSGFAHTIPKLACPGGGGGNGSAASLLISTARYAGVEVDAAARTVTADAGAPLRAVIDAAEAGGLSLPASPYWEGVSVGGAVSTGSHATRGGAGAAPCTTMSWGSASSCPPERPTGGPGWCRSPKVTRSFPPRSSRLAFSGSSPRLVY